jgi:hypothetical protein
MPALAAGRIELELDAAAPRQAAKLAQEFIARQRIWMAIDQRQVKTRPLVDRGCRP